MLGGLATQRRLFLGRFELVHVELTRDLQVHRVHVRVDHHPQLEHAHTACLLYAQQLPRLFHFAHGRLLHKAR